MDGALNVKNIDYGKVNLYITKSGGDVNQPTTTMESFPYIGKKTYHPFPHFRVNYRYRGVIPAYKTLKQDMVSETSTHYPLIYGKSSCALLYDDLQNLSIQVSLRDNFKVKLDEIYFSYVFLNGQPYQTYMDKEGFKAYISQFNFATHCSSTACGISSEQLLTEDDMIRSIYRFYIVFQTRKVLNTQGVQLPYVDELNPFKSRYNLESYRKLCDEFDVYPTTDSFGLSKVGVQNSQRA